MNKEQEEVYRNKLDEFEKFLKDKELPKDFSDWNMLDWQIYALDYLKANWDHAVEEAEDPDVPKIPKSFEKNSYLWNMYFQAVKITGKYDEALQYMEESLTFADYEELNRFIEWFTKKNYAVGSRNYFAKYLEFKIEESTTNTDPEICDGCKKRIIPYEGIRCHLKPKIYHFDPCWSEHLGECIEED